MPVSAANFNAACTRKTMPLLAGLFYPGNALRYGAGALSGFPLGSAGAADTAETANNLVDQIIKRIHTINDPNEFKNIVSDVLGLSGQNKTLADNTFTPALIANITNEARNSVYAARILELRNENPQAAEYLSRLINAKNPDDKQEAIQRLGTLTRAKWLEIKDTFTQELATTNDPDRIAVLFGGNNNKFLTALPAIIPTPDEAQQICGAARVTQLRKENPALVDWIRAHPNDDAIYRKIGGWSEAEWSAAKTPLLAGIKVDLAGAIVPPATLNNFRALFGNPPPGGGGMVIAGGNRLLAAIPAEGDEDDEINLTSARGMVGGARIAELAELHPRLFAWICDNPESNPQDNPANGIYARVGSWTPQQWSDRKAALLTGLAAQSVPAGGPIPAAVQALLGGADKLLPGPLVPGIGATDINLDRVLVMVCEARIALLAAESPQAAKYLTRTIAENPPADQIEIKKLIAARTPVDWLRDKNSLLERLAKVDGNNAAAVKDIFKVKAAPAPAVPGAPAPPEPLPLLALQPPPPAAAPAVARVPVDGALGPDEAKEMVGEARIMELARQNAKAAAYLRAFPAADQLAAKIRIGGWPHNDWEANKKLLFKNLAELPAVTPVALAGVFGATVLLGDTTRLLVFPGPVPAAHPAGFADPDAVEMVGEARIAELAIEHPRAAAYLKQRAGQAEKRDIGNLPRAGAGSWEAKKLALIQGLALAATEAEVVGAFSGLDKLLVAPIAPADAPVPEVVNEMRGDARITVLAQTHKKLAAIVKTDPGWNAAAKQEVGRLNTADWSTRQATLKGHLAAANVSADGNALKSIIGNATANSGALLPAAAVVINPDHAKQIVGLARVTEWIEPALLAGHKARDYFNRPDPTDPAAVTAFDALIQQIGANPNGGKAHWENLARELTNRDTTVDRLTEICTQFGMANPQLSANAINAHNQLLYVRDKIQAEGPLSLKAAFADPVNPAVLAALGTKSPTDIDTLLLQLLDRENATTAQVDSTLQGFGFPPGAAAPLATQVATDKLALTDKVWIQNFYIRKLVVGLHLTLTKTQIEAINAEDFSVLGNLSAICVSLNARTDTGLLGDKLGGHGDLKPAAEAIFAAELAALPAGATPQDKADAVTNAIRNEQLRQNNYRDPGNNLCLPPAGRAVKYQALYEWFSKTEKMPFLGDPDPAHLPVGATVGNVLRPEKIVTIIGWLQDDAHADANYTQFCTFLDAGPPDGCNFSALPRRGLDHPNAYHPDEKLFTTLKREARLSNRASPAFTEELDRARRLLEKAELQQLDSIKDPDLLNTTQFMKDQLQSSSGGVASQSNLDRQPHLVDELHLEFRDQIAARMARIKAREYTLQDLNELEKLLPKKGASDRETEANIRTMYPGINDAVQKELLNVINGVAKQKANLERFMKDYKKRLLGAKKLLVQSEAKQTSHRGLLNDAAARGEGVGTSGGVIYSGVSADLDAEKVVYIADQKTNLGITEAEFMQNLKDEMESHHGYSFFSRSRPPAVAFGVAGAAGAPNPALSASGWRDTVAMTDPNNPAVQVNVGVSKGIQKFYSAGANPKLSAYAIYADSGKAVTVTVGRKTNLTAVYDRASDLPLSVYHKAQKSAPAGTQPRMFLTGGNEKQAREAYKVLIAKGVPHENIDNTSAFRFDKLSKNDQKKFLGEAAILRDKLTLGPNAKGVRPSTIKELTKTALDEDAQVETKYGSGRMIK